MRFKYSNCYFRTIFFVLISFSVSAQTRHLYDVTKYGAIGDNHTLNTILINSTIEKCAADGGGNVYFPKGIYLTATIHLKTNVNIIISDSAEIKAVNNIDLFQHLSPNSELAKYNTISDQGNNANSAFDTVWTKALILGEHIHNVKIMGMGRINGTHLFNPKGEENMRGPHTILIADGDHIEIKDVTVENAANYAILGYALKNSVFNNVEIQQGWDGIHIRGGENVTIKNCKLETGDDAIAGGYWHNFKVMNSVINSSCNGIRVIMPVDRFYVRNCQFEGPGKYSHRTSGAAHRTNMLAGIYVQPGGWGLIKGNITNVYFKNLKLSNMDNAFMFELNKENNSENIHIEDISANNIHGDIYFNSHFGGVFKSVYFKNVNFNNDYNKVREHWALNLHGIDRLYMTNINFNNDANSYSNAFNVKDVKKIIQKNITVNH